jgi:hypothetical protein
MTGSGVTRLFFVSEWRITPSAPIRPTGRILWGQRHGASRLSPPKARRGRHRAVNDLLYDHVARSRRGIFGLGPLDAKCSPMAHKTTLNERRLTKRQVRELISSGARPRPDLAVAFESTLRQSSLVYELEGDRYLLVFGEQVSGLG